MSQFQKDFDVARVLFGRRRALQLFAAALGAPLLGCGDPPDDNPAQAASCTPGQSIPPETAGPYPGDGSNGVNALAMASIIRQDITPNLDDTPGKAPGLPLQIRLQVLDAETCLPLPGAAVYLWQNDREGEYSMYTVPDKSYLRGVQIADENGWVTFDTIFPGCYKGRWPHTHFEVFRSGEGIASRSGLLATSQLAFARSICETVYALEGYEVSEERFSPLTLASDGPFKDGIEQQVATISGSPGANLTASLVVPVTT